MSLSYKKILLIFVAILLIASFSLMWLEEENERKMPLSVNYLDVGQGDATLIQYLGTYQILIDGGPSGKRLLPELSSIISPTDHTIELVILTHPDKDHLAGLIDVVENYSVKAVLSNGQEADTNIYRQYKEVIQNKGIQEYVFKEGSRVLLGVDLELRSYNPDLVVEEKSDRNENSVVVRMDYGDNSFLFVGDADFATEKDIASDEENVDVDWFKVGHHGSKNSTSDEFLQAVTPKWSIISAGKSNRYGHPNEELLERLRSVGTNILRTDEKGTIVIECESVEMECVLR